MSQRFLVLSILFLSLRVFALTGVDELIESLNKKNQEILSLEKIVESKEALIQSSKSMYYPTLNVVGGWGQNKTDDLAAIQKGYLGYAEGKLNLFRGFKDQAIVRQKNIDLKIASLNLDSKKRSLRSEFNEIVSEMIFLHHLQSILNEEYKVNQEQKQMAAKKVAAGLTGVVDNLEFDLRENEIQIEQKQIDQQHLEAHQKLIKLYGEEIPDSQIDKVSFSSIENLSQIPAQFKLENSLDFQRENLNADLAQSEKNEITADYKPSLDFSYSFGRLTPSEDSSAKYNESKYAIQLTIPLFSGFETHYKDKSATSNILANEKNIQQVRNNVEIEFNIMKTKINELTLMYSLIDKKIINSQKYFNLTLAEYKRGVKNSPDLVGATERLFTARKKKYEIQKDLEIFKAKIDQLM